MQTPSSTTVTAMLALVAIACSASALMRSGSQQASLLGHADSLAKIRGMGKIDVCYAVWPHAETKEPGTGNVTGHDAEAIEYIATQIGANVEYHEQTFATMAGAVQSGTCDVALS